MPDQNQIATIAACLNVTVAHLRDGKPVDTQLQGLRRSIYDLTEGLPREDLDILESMVRRLRALHLMQEND